MSKQSVTPSAINSANPAFGSNEYRNVAVAQLQESATNPRRRFNQQGLQELAESIKAQGMLAPLLVREIAKEQFEIVAGARRFRAARLAEVAQVPVRVVKLTDAAAIEAQVVENLQREDIHPLEEATAFKVLLELVEPKYSVAHIAARSGKSEAYVVGRIKLTDLIEPVGDAFLADKITIGHALLIAKLPPAQQQEAFNAAFRQMWTSEGNQPVLIPVRELSAWIQSNIMLELAAAPFDKDDETLCPQAGSCIACPKRTGANALLFSDVRKDACTDPQCFRAKVDAHIAKTIETKPTLVQISSAWQSREGAPLGKNRYAEIEIRANGRTGKAKQAVPAPKTCRSMTEAIYMDGGKRGQTVKVCADFNCRVHHPDKQQPSPEQVERTRAAETSGMALVSEARTPTEAPAGEAPQAAVGPQCGYRLSAGGEGDTQARQGSRRGCSLPIAHRMCAAGCGVPFNAIARGRPAAGYGASLPRGCREGRTLCARRLRRQSEEGGTQEAGECGQQAHGCGQSIIKTDSHEARQNCRAFLFPFQSYG